MHELRRNIAKFTIKLHQQIKVPLWSLANEMIIYALATNSKPKWGRRAKYVYKIICISERIRLGDYAIFLIGAVKCLWLWFKLKREADSRSRLQPREVFVGFGASSEEDLYAQFLETAENPSLRINVVTKKGVAKLGCPKLSIVVSLLFQLSFKHSKCVRAAIDEIASNASYFLTSCAINIGEYALYLAYWAMAKENGLNKATFIAADMSAFACVDAGLKTSYVQHGLLSLCVLLPGFTVINAFSCVESHYLRVCLTNSLINHKNTGAYSHNEVCTTILILSPNYNFHQRQQQLQPIMSLAKKFGLTVVIRCSRSAPNTILSKLKNSFSAAVIDNPGNSLKASILQWQPSIVVAWGSTGLITALDHGCLPVSLSDPAEVCERWATIYPLWHKVLFWPRDSVNINASLGNNAKRSELVTELREYSNVSLLSI